MKRPPQGGFSIVEVVLAIGILGLLFAFSIPAINGYSKRHQLVAATENIAGQLRLARQNAIVTGAMQTFHCSENQVGATYHLHNEAAASPVWTLPSHVNYSWDSGTQWQFRWTKDGRCLDSGMIILEDQKGARDTLTVLASGLVLTR